MSLALVTGASRGLGHAFALGLAPRHHILAVGRTVGALEELDDAIRAKGGEATLAPMDVTNPEAMAQLAQAVGARWGKIDLWVHAAVHAAPLSPIAQSSDKDWDKSQACNVEATRRLMILLAPLLTGATVAFFDDPQAGKPHFGAYGATKAAQIALARSYGVEMRAQGTKVVVLAPQPMATATRARFYPGENRAVLASPSQEATRLLAELDRIDQG